MNEDLCSRYILDCISRGDIDGLFVVYRDVLSTATWGSVLKDLIEKNVEVLSCKYYNRSFSTFRELVEKYQDDHSPLRKLCVNNNYILTTRECGIPFPFETFLTLLARTTLKGLVCLEEDLKFRPLILHDEKDFFSRCAKEDLVLQNKLVFSQKTSGIFNKVLANSYEGFYLLPSITEDMLNPYVRMESYLEGVIVGTELYVFEYKLEVDLGYPECGSHEVKVVLLHTEIDNPSIFELVDDLIFW